MCKTVNFRLYDIPTVVVAECVDTNPSMCQEMKEKEALGCNYRPHSDYCCQTCKPGGEEPSSPREEQTEPPSTQRPAPSPHCYDNSPTVCEFLVEENSLDCYSNVVRSLCCHTCEVHSD
ncbi:hypothetical protein Y032_0053g2407 [Ancylostoma ceylanicum]|uniref:ShKT domain-containing protein n=1 Tax=Ancylostoma ceylanicum TaxID=53326 RepID=A0A016U8Q9_9BILA|nr:hypothetical protein Y032_0053g2407 [Ancylostoma ceylanicum]